MNVSIAYHVDLAMPFDGLIKAKGIIFLSITLRNFKHAQRHIGNIENSHEAGVFYRILSS